MTEPESTARKGQLMTLWPQCQFKLEKNKRNIMGEGEEAQLLKKIKTKNGITSEGRVERAQVWSPSELGSNGSRLLKCVWPLESSVSRDSAALSIKWGS